MYLVNEIKNYYNNNNNNNNDMLKDIKLNLTVILYNFKSTLILISLKYFNYYITLQL